MRPWMWLALLIVLFVVVSGGAVVVGLASKLNESQRRVRAELRAAGTRHGIDPDVTDAIGYVESRWRLGAVNQSGADGARGGAYGPTQITERTARAHGFNGSMETLAEDAWLSAEWTGRILAARPGGPPQSIEDAAAWWNAGKTSVVQLGPDHVTRRDYIPKALAALEIVRETPA